MLRRISLLADNPPEPWHRRVSHGGTTGFACGAPFGRELVRAGDREIKKKGSDRVADRIQSYWKE